MDDLREKVACEVERLLYGHVLDHSPGYHKYYQVVADAILALLTPELRKAFVQGWDARDLNMCPEGPVVEAFRRWPEAKP